MMAAMTDICEMSYEEEYLLHFTSLEKLDKILENLDMIRSVNGPFLPNYQ